MEKELTPEERLLRLIRGQKGGKLGPESSRQNSEPPEGTAEVGGLGENETPEKIKKEDSLKRKDFRDGQAGSGPGTEQTKHHDLVQKTVKRRAGKRKISGVRSINRILLCLLVAILVCLFFEMVVAKPYLARVEIPKVEEILLKSQFPPEEVLVEGVQEEEPLVKLKPLSYYTEPIGKRDLFKPLVIKEPLEEKKEPEVTLEKLARDLVLKGIIAGPQPQAIIEDKRTKRTYFLNRGEKIGQIVIEDIQDGKVKLKFQEQEMNLAM